MKSIKISINNEGVLKSITSSGEFTGGEYLDIGFKLLYNTAINILNQKASTPGYDEEQSKKDRAVLYDTLVLGVSSIAEAIYPEFEELKGTPEDFLAHLEEKSNEITEQLNELKKLKGE